MNPFEAGELDRAQRNQELGLPVGVRLAPIWRRVVAQMVDQILVAVPVVGVGLIAGIRINSDISTNQLLALNASFIGLAFVYEFLMVALLGRTVGKFALGTRVVRVDDATHIMWSSSAIRALVPLAAGAIPGIGMFATLAVYATASFDRRQQGLHDKACGSIVVMHQARSAATSPRQ